MLSVNCARTFTNALIATLVLCAITPAFGQFGGGGGGMGSRAGLGGMGGGAGGSGPPGPQQKKRYQPPKFAPTGPRINVAAVRLKGRYSASESRIRAKLQTREGRQFDPATVQADVRQLLSSGLCYDVKTYRDDTPNGIVITFELFEQPTVQYIEFSGNKVREKTLLKKCELSVGQPLSRYRVEEAKRKLEEFYRGRGNSFVEVEIQEGTKDGDMGAVFVIDEGPRQRIRWTKFEGNTIASDSRLRTQIDSKPGILWLFKGQVDTDVIDEDVDKLISYYRSLGFFRARIRKEMQFDEDNEWLTLTFHIDEGPRYAIRSISFNGNRVFREQDLLATTKTAPGDFFDLKRMNTDVRALKDTYGANGYIKANVQATPQFDEEPGQLDLVYEIEEGSQYRVGSIIVNIDGDNPHTKHTVALNRINMREGDIINGRALRSSEVRLQRSQLFENGPMGGPQISVVPRDDGSRTATSPRDYR